MWRSVLPLRLILLIRVTNTNGRMQLPRYYSAIQNGRECDITVTRDYMITGPRDVATKRGYITGRHKGATQLPNGAT